MEKEYKTCTGCKKLKPRTDFYGHPATRSKLHSRCKECFKSSLKTSRLNPDHKKRWAEYQWRSVLRRLYGIEQEDYENFLLAQNNICAICGNNTGSARTSKLHVDHDAETGKVRGLLCSQCNNGLGRFHDSPDLLRKAANYIENPPAKTIQLQARKHKRGDGNKVKHD